MKRKYTTTNKERLRRSKNLKLRWKSGKMVGSPTVLSEEQAIEVKERLLKNEGIVYIAKIYEVSVTAIYNIKSGVTFPHILNAKDRRLLNNISTVVTDTQIRNIVKLISNGVDLTVIAKKYKVTVSLISGIKYGKAFKRVVTDEMLNSMLEGSQKVKRTPHTTKDEQQQITFLRSNGFTINDVAEMYDLNRTSISRIVNRTTLKGAYKL